MAKKKNDNGEQAAEKPARKPRQGHLPTMEPEVIPEIDSAAEEYVDARDRRMKMGEREVELRTLLLGLMKKHHLSNYEYEGKTVSIVADEKIKVRAKKEAGDEQAEE